MRARIINLQYEDRDVESNRPYLEFYQQHGGPIFEAFDRRIDARMEITRNIYEGIKFRSSNGMEEIYYFNIEDVKTAVPIMNGIIDERARMAERKKEIEVEGRLLDAQIKQSGAEFLAQEAERRATQSDERAIFFEEMVDELATQTHIRLLRFIQKKIKIFIAEAQSL